MSLRHTRNLRRWRREPKLTREEIESLRNAVYRALAERVSAHRDNLCIVRNVFGMPYSVPDIERLAQLP